MYSNIFNDKKKIKVVVFRAQKISVSMIFSEIDI